MIKPLVIEFFPMPFLAGMGCLVLILMILRLRRKSGLYLFRFSLFCIYLLFVAGVVAFPIPLGFGVEKPPWSQSAVYIFSRVNLRPFYFYGLFTLPAVVIFREIIGNIVLTMPFGFGIPYIAPVKARAIVWLAPALGILFETIQLGISLAIGAYYRGVDINDVILNAAGVWIGFIAFRVFTQLQSSGHRVQISLR